MLAGPDLGKSCFIWVELVPTVAVVFLGLDGFTLERSFIVDGPMIIFHVWASWSWRLLQRLFLHLCITWRTFSRVLVL